VPEKNHVRPEKKREPFCNREPLDWLANIVFFERGCGFEVEGVGVVQQQIRMQSRGYPPLFIFTPSSEEWL